MSYSISLTPSRWDVWRHDFADKGNGYPQLVGTTLAAVITDDGMGSVTVECTECMKPLEDPKAGPDRGYGHPAKSYTSRTGARAALARHLRKVHSEAVTA